MSTLLVPWLALPAPPRRPLVGLRALARARVGREPAGSPRRPVRLRRRRARGAVRGADGRDRGARDARSRREPPPRASCSPGRGAACTWTAGRSRSGSPPSPPTRRRSSSRERRRSPATSSSTTTRRCSRSSIGRWSTGASVDRPRVLHVPAASSICCSTRATRSRRCCPIGVGREIVRGDSLWLYQPAMAVMAAMLALGLYRWPAASCRCAGSAPSRRSSARSRRCSSATRSGAASRSWGRRGRCPSSPRSSRWPPARCSCATSSRWPPSRRSCSAC